MPAYVPGNLLSISPNDPPVKVWNAEQPVVGAGGVSASQGVALTRVSGDRGGFEISGFFSGAPGAFEIDVQVADEDVDSEYQTIANGNITSVDSVNQTFHFDAPQVNGRFVRLLMRSRTNAVNVTAFVKG